MKVSTEGWGDWTLGIMGGGCLPDSGCLWGTHCLLTCPAEWECISVTDAQCVGWYAPPSHSSSSPWGHWGLWQPNFWSLWKAGNCLTLGPGGYPQARRG